MSTKTTFKRIALVAVASLGFGVLSTVTPANAAVTAGTVTAATTATVKPSSRVGVAAQVATTFTFAAGVANTDKLYFKTKLSAKPAGSTATTTFSFGSSTGTGTAPVAADFAFVAGGDATLTAATATLPVAAGTVVLNSSFTPDVAGAYSIITWFDFNNDGVIDGDEKAATKTITVAADAPSISLTVYGSNPQAGTLAATNYTGAIVKVSLTNGGVAASLSGLESFSVAASNSGAVYNAADTAAVTTLGRADFDKDGNAYVRLKKAAAGASVLTITGAVGTGVASLSSAVSRTFILAAADTDSDMTIVNATGVGGSTKTKLTANGTWALTSDTLKSTTVSMAGSTTAASEEVAVKFCDTAAGDVTGSASICWTDVFTSGTDKTISISAPAFLPSAAGQILQAVFLNATFTLTVSITATDTAAASATLSASSVRAIKGGSVTVTYTVLDSYGVALANKTVTATPQASGRNSTTAAVNLVTNSLGQVTYTLADAPTTASSVLTTDSVIITDGTTPKTLSITWVTSFGVDKVVVSTWNTTSGVANPTTVTKGINASSSGAQATQTSVTAKVTDANATIIVGVPVTFTITGTGAAVTSTTATAYTDSTGVATAKVYGWVAGSYTVTATAEGKSGTGSIAFAQEEPTYARNVSATVEGAVVTALVKDRYGNPVKGVKLYATKTGVGYFGTGLSTAEGTTNSAGKVEFNIAGGAATVTVSAVDPSLVAGSTYAQTCAAAGFTSCATTATAILATVAGTSLVDEKYVGASFAPAGNASATVEASADNSAQVAADAAAEATDAANAATDAANAAAEAADAATAAAQDAADAVAALSTQVSEMVNALKKQITALTNLVIKIQKKVKA